MVLVRHAGGRLVPLGIPGAFLSYRLSETADLEEMLAAAARFVAPFAESARSRPSRPAAHRLMRLVEATASDVDALRAGLPGRNLSDVVELGQVVGLLSEWEQDPAGREVVNDLKDPGIYAHAILVLAIARVLRDSWRNGVALVKQQRTRAPDVKVLTDHGDLAVELKHPREFDGGDWVREKGPGRLASDMLSRSGPQMRTARASVLVVAGYRIPEIIRDELSDELASRLAKRQSIAATCVLSLGSHPEEQAEAGAAASAASPLSRPLTRAETSTILAFPVAVTVSRSRYYGGPIPVLGLDDAGSGLHLPARSMIVRGGRVISPA